MLELIELSTLYKDSFLVGLRAMQDDGRYLQYDLAQAAANFDAFVQKLRDKKDRAKIPPDRVPQTDYWLYEDRTTFVGHLSLRYELNEHLLLWGDHIGYWIHPAHRRQGYGTTALRLGLAKARVIGLHRALVTCDETNLGSKKIIEANGGQLEDAIQIEDDPIKKLRYWIDIP